MKLFTCFTIIFKLSVAIRIADILLNKKESPLNLNNVNQFSVSVKKNIFQKKLAFKFYINIHQTIKKPFKQLFQPSASIKK